jgi:hypothetical protein
MRTLFFFLVFLLVKRGTEMVFLLGERKKRKDENQRGAPQLSPAVRRSVGNNLRNEMGYSRGSDRLRSKRS